jgi:hypothetical protein
MHPACYKCRLPLEIDHQSGLHPKCFCDWFGLEKPEEFHDVVARSAETSRDEWTRITSSFFHGKFRKYSARLGQKSYLLKVQQPELLELPSTEYLCNQIARNIGLWVPNFFFIRFQNELDTFVCENFIQSFPGCDLVHIYRFLDRPEQFSCEGLLKILEEKVQRHEDIQRFVKLCLFDSLIGNHDRHGRNLGLIQSESDLRLAPFYDNPSYLAQENPLLLGAYHEPRGAIATKESREPNMHDYIKEWLRLGFAEMIFEFKGQINIKQIQTLIEDSFISEKRKQALNKLISRRYQELCDGIKKL